MNPLLISMRPQHWIKNLLLFAGLVFGGELFNSVKALTAVQAFAVFCLFSSTVYLVNDLFDRDSDHLHPLKKFRPIAAGALSTKACLWTAVVLAGMGMVWSIFIGTRFLALGAAYLAVSLLYSWRLKRIVIVDVMLIASGFVMRVLAGTVAIEVETSQWLLLCTMLLSLFLAFAKRRHELVRLQGRAIPHREVLIHYSAAFLDQMISIVCAGTLLCYALYTINQDTSAQVGTGRLIFTVPLVMYGIFRYLYLIYQCQGGDDPTILLLRDRWLFLSVVVWLTISGAILYL